MVEHKHPITPPPELVQQWWEEADKQLSSYYDYIATQAARWGADQELWACCELLDINGCPSKWIDMLRAARRPKPPSLAEEATTELQSHMQELRVHGLGWNASTISAALERLQHLEQESNDN